MNGEIYDRIIKQYEQSKSPKEKRDCMFTMLCMIGTNHLQHIEGKQKKQDRMQWLNFAFLIVVLLILVAQNPGALQFIVRLIGGIF